MMPGEGQNESIETCSVCLEHMGDRSPRALHCLHSFCLNCAEALAKDGVISCPICRQITPLGPGGASGLPVNFYIPKLQKSSTCTSCRNPVPAVAYCNTCKDYMCVRCKRLHSNFSAFSKHIVNTIQEHDKCNVHKKPIAYMCKNCQEDICKECSLLDKHKGHQSSVVRIDMETKQLIRDISTCAKDYILRLKNRKSYLSRVLFAVKLAEQDILVQVDSLINQIKQEAHYMLSTLDIHRQQVYRVYEEISETADALRKAENNIVSYEIGSYEDLLDKVTYLKHNVDREIDKANQLFSLTFATPRYRRFDVGYAGLGKLSMELFNVGKMIQYCETARDDRVWRAGGEIARYLSQTHGKTWPKVKHNRKKRRPPLKGNFESEDSTHDELDLGRALRAEKNKLGSENFLCTDASSSYSDIRVQKEPRNTKALSNIDGIKEIKPFD